MEGTSTSRRIREFVFGSYWMPTFMSVLTLLMICDKFFNSFNYRADNIYGEERVNLTGHKVGQAVICSVILVLLPFAQIFNDRSSTAADSTKKDAGAGTIVKIDRKYKFISTTLSGCALIVCTMFLESLFNRKQCFSTFFASSIVFRVIYYQTFFDNFALCVAFSSNVGAISMKQERWYATANVLVWSYFFCALIIRHIFDRIRNRISDNLRALIVLQKNLKHEEEKCRRLYDAHIPRTHGSSSSKSHPPHSGSNQSKDASRVSGLDDPIAVKCRQKANRSTEAIGNELIMDQAKALGLVPPISDLSDVDVSSLSNKLEKKNVILVAIRLMKGFEQECALSVERQHFIYDAINHHAGKFNIVPARCFGDVWIGYYERSDNNVAVESNNLRNGRQSSDSGSVTPRSMDANVLSASKYHTSAHKVLCFCCEVDVMAGFLGTRVAIAIEQGAVTLGFSVSSHFNIYGQEIRWLLRVIDLEDYGHINVSEGFRSQILSDRKINPEISNLSIEKRNVEYPWKKGFPSTIMSVTNVNDYAGNKDEIDATLKDIMARVTAPRLEVYQDGIMRLQVQEADSSDSWRDVMVEKSFTRRSSFVTSGSAKALSGSASAPSFMSGLFSSGTSAGNAGRGREAGKRLGSAKAKEHAGSRAGSSNIASSKSYGSSSARGASLFDSSSVAHDPSLSSRDDFLYHWEWFQSFESSEYWKESIGREFKRSVEERTGISLRDPLLRSMTREELKQSLAQAHRNLQEIVWQLLRFWVLSFPQIVREHVQDGVRSVARNVTFVVRYATGAEADGATTARAPGANVGDEAAQVTPYESFLHDLLNKSSWVHVTLREQYTELRRSRALKMLGLVPKDDEKGAKVSKTTSSRDSQSSLPTSERITSRRHHRKIYVTSVNDSDAIEEHGPVSDRAGLRNKPGNASPRHSSRITRPAIPMPSLSPNGAMAETSLWKREGPAAGDEGAAGNAMIATAKLPTSSTPLVTVAAPKPSAAPSKAPGANSDEASDAVSCNSDMSLVVLDDGSVVRTPSYGKYNRDLRMFFLHDMVNTTMELALMVIALYPVQAVMTTDCPSLSNAIFRCLVFIHFIYTQTLGRARFAGNSLLWISYHVLMMLVFPCWVLHTSYSTVFHDYGDFGGDAMLNIFCLLRMPASLNMHPVLVVLDGFFMRGILTLKDKWTNQKCHLRVPARNQSFYTFSVFLICFIAIYFGSIASYVLEHRILPAVMRKLEHARDRTNDITQRLYPRMHRSLYSLGPMSLYKGVTLLCIHVKALDAMCEYVDSHVVGHVAREIELVMDASFAECGLVKITEFSGVYIVTSARSLGLESNHRNLTNAYSIVHVVQMIRAKIEELTKVWQFNIALGIALHVGDVYIGFNGLQRYSLDVIGSARDITMTMASHNSEGLFASRAFESEIQRLKPVDYLVHQQTVTQSGVGDSYWLCVDGTLAGMHLDDFLWLGKLGEGGYGMVHLAAEKFSKIRYAIKVIPLKQSNGLRMTNMMKQECLILQTMAHKNVVKLHYSFIDKDQLYLVMTYVKGGNLRQVIDNATTGFAVSQLRNWFAELVLAIEYIHDKGIIHRDIKPANCMIDTNGHLRLADFGLSKKDNSVRDSAMWAELRAATVANNYSTAAAGTGGPLVGGAAAPFGIDSASGKLLLGGGGGTAPPQVKPMSSVSSMATSQTDSAVGSVAKAAPEAPNAWLSRTVQRRLQKFLPLKAKSFMQTQVSAAPGGTATGGGAAFGAYPAPVYNGAAAGLATGGSAGFGNGSPSGSVAGDVHQNVTVLVIKRDAIFTERKRTFRFSNFSVNIISARDESEAESLLSWNQVDAILIELANTVEESDMLAISVSAGNVPMSSGSAKANRAAKDKARAERDDAAKEAEQSLDQSLGDSNQMLVNSLSLTENSEDGPPNGGGGGADGKAGAATHADASAIAEESALQAAANTLQRVRDLVKHFCLRLLNTLPVYVYGVSSDNLRLFCMEAGAKDTFQDFSTGDIVEPVWRAVFSIPSDETMTEEDYDEHEERANMAGIAETNSMDNSMSNSYGAPPSFFAGSGQPVSGLDAANSRLMHPFLLYPNDSVSSDGNSTDSPPISAATAAGGAVVLKPLLKSARNASNNRRRPLLGGFATSGAAGAYVHPAGQQPAAYYSATNNVPLTAHGYQQNQDDQDHVVGTVHFMAPEVIKKNCKHGAAVDWWACGVTFYYCLTKKHLFSGDDRDTVFKAILNDPIDIAGNLAHLEGSDRDVVSLIEGLVCRDVTQRLGSRTIVMVTTSMPTGSALGDGGHVNGTVHFEGMGDADGTGFTSMAVSTAAYPLPSTSAAAAAAGPAPVAMGGAAAMHSGATTVATASTPSIAASAAIRSQPMLLDGVARIKNHAFFQGIDWDTVSSSDNNTYKPGQYPPKNSDPADKARFYGDYDSIPGMFRSQNSHIREMEMRSSVSLHRHSLNKQRLKNSKHASKSLHPASRKQNNIANNPQYFAKMKKILSGQFHPPDAQAHVAQQGAHHQGGSGGATVANGHSGGGGGGINTARSMAAGFLSMFSAGGAAAAPVGGTPTAAALPLGAVGAVGAASARDPSPRAVETAAGALAAEAATAALPPLMANGVVAGVAADGAASSIIAPGAGVDLAHSLPADFDLVLHGVIEEEEDAEDDEDDDRAGHRGEAKATAATAAAEDDDDDEAAVEVGLNDDAEEPFLGLSRSHSLHTPLQLSPPSSQRPPVAAPKVHDDDDDDDALFAHGDDEEKDSSEIRSSHASSSGSLPKTSPASQSPKPEPRPKPSHRPGDVSA